VNGTPVAHKVNPKAKNSVIIGALAGPKAEITVRYCSEKTKCTDPCVIPKDDFMNALGGGSEGDSGWNSESPSGEEGQLKSELDKLDHETRGDRQKINLFKDWIPSGEAETCQGKLKTGR
jgi:hypothetical protein